MFSCGEGLREALSSTECFMQFVSYRDLRNEPSALRKKLASEGELIVTVDNKPFAVMINLGDENVQDILLMVSRLRAQMAARSIRSQVRRDGLDKVNLNDINALIKKTRADRSVDAYCGSRRRYLSLQPSESEELACKSP
jgi:hypothetical protein